MCAIDEEKDLHTSLVSGHQWCNANLSPTHSVVNNETRTQLGAIRYAASDNIKIRALVEQMDELFHFRLTRHLTGTPVGVRLSRVWAQRFKYQKVIVKRYDHVGFRCSDECIAATRSSDIHWQAHKHHPCCSMSCA